MCRVAAGDYWPDHPAIVSRILRLHEEQQRQVPDAGPAGVTPAAVAAAAHTGA